MLFFLLSTLQIQKFKDIKHKKCCKNDKQPRLQNIIQFHHLWQIDHLTATLSQSEGSRQLIHSRYVRIHIQLSVCPFSKLQHQLSIKGRDDRQPYSISSDLISFLAYRHKVDGDLKFFYQLKNLVRVVAFVAVPVADNNY